MAMNWELIPRGKARMGASDDGMREISLNAARRLAQVEAALGKKDWSLLQDTLISTSSIKQLSRAKLVRIGLGVFMRLARAYDMAVAPVKGGR